MAKGVQGGVIRSWGVGCSLASTRTGRTVRVSNLFVGLVAAVGLVTGPVFSPGANPEEAQVLARDSGRDRAPTDIRSGRQCGWIAPVDAVVVDPFRPPPHPYGPGNRGLEYQTTPGQVVVAVADGRVGFVGPVGGVFYVVVAHGVKLRSTYGPVEEIQVVSGQIVKAGTQIATAGAAMHLTARVGAQYYDPALLLAGGCLRPRLIE